MIDGTDRGDPGGAAAARAVAGLCDGRWQVRRESVHWIATHGDAAARAAARPLLRDPRTAVRVAALYAVAGRREDAGAVPLLVERALEDESVRVRRFAVTLLAHVHAHPQLAGFFEALLATETDAKLHRAAGIGLWRSREGRPDDA